MAFFENAFSTFFEASAFFALVGFAFVAAGLEALAGAALAVTGLVAFAGADAFAEGALPFDFALLAGVEVVVSFFVFLPLNAAAQPSV